MQFDQSGRREFITFLGGVVAAWPRVVVAQQADRMRRIGVLTAQAESDPVPQSWITAFATRLRELGWVEDKNVQIDYRWGANEATRLAPLAKEP